MRAALLTQQGSPFEIVDDVEIAAPSAGQLRVRITHCGICHSDLSVADGVFPCPLPIVLGHEAAGVVDAVGADVAGFAPGDPVLLSPCPPCGVCYFCVRGEPGVCVNTNMLQTNALPDGSTGLSRRGETVFRGIGLGGFGEFVLVPANGAVKVPSDVPLGVACVIGCAVQTGVGSVLNTAKVEEGATVLVMGLGGIGLSVVQGAQIAGAARILVSDPVAEKRELARRLGATDLIDPTTQDVLSTVGGITGIGVDYAFDGVGRGALIELGLAATRPGGTTVCVGAAPLGDTVTIGAPAFFTLSEKKLIGCTLGSCNSLREIPRLIALWRTGRLDLEALITSRRPLSEINEAMDDLRAARGIRTVLSVSE